MEVGSQFLQISGSTVLITGATGGLGQAIARRLSALGATLVLTGRRVDVLESLAADLGARGLVADLSLADEVDRVAAESGEVDILIANAGLPASGTLDSFSLEEIDRALDVNLRAPIVLARELAPRMVTRRRGHLLFMSSLAGKAATPRASLYNATKFGLRGFAGALRSDLRGTGVGVSAIFPGFISESGMYADAEVKLPLGIGTRSPEDVAGAVVDAIERNRGEVDVAPFPLRAGTLFASVAPELAAAVAKRLGSDDVSRKMADGQSDKR
ncbi:MAG TPA: SDR family NAD(P)-dependent oxidoreductase [Solirubrobacteraceae bacterium]|nr:SDR family NAD(P)-dependent oxidoreductase [Solirubrobacteraceae bacterium]